MFPIKVNQLREVVEEILDAGAEFHFGLECGSKPELFAALAVHRDPESVVICNGYKDAIFIQTALLGRKLGKQIIMVVEKIEELRQIVEISREMNVEPLVGFRVRLQHPRRGQVGDERRREREVRPVHGGTGFRQRVPQGAGSRALPQARAFPRRQPGARHRHDQARRA